MAERVGFEPTSPVLPGYPLSRRALSTAQTPLRGCSFTSLANAPTAHNQVRTPLWHLRKNSRIFVGRGFSHDISTAYTGGFSR